MLCKSLRKLPGVEGDLTTILVYIPVETAAVLTLVGMATQRKLVSVCVCECTRVRIPGENASSGRHGVRDLKQTEAQPLGKENKIGIARLRAQLGDVIAGKEKSVKSLGWQVCDSGRARGKAKLVCFPRPPFRRQCEHPA